jgi:hypothetical protein
MTIVANANEQATAVGIGKSGYRLSQLTSICHTVFEVLLLVLALCYQPQQVLAVAEKHHAKVKRKNDMPLALIRFFALCPPRCLDVCGKKCKFAAKRNH